MPILKSEPYLYPDDLLEAEQVEETSWWAMYTLSRQEKTLVRLLRGRSIPHYCPVVANRYRSPAGRIRTSYLPLFSNYVFVCGTEEDRYQAISTGCVSRHLRIQDVPQFLSQIRTINMLIDSGRPMTVESQLEPGTLIRVKSGPLSGVQGVIVKRRGDSRLLVSVDFLQQGASVALEDWEIERTV